MNRLLCQCTNLKRLSINGELSRASYTVVDLMPALDRHKDSLESLQIVPTLSKAQIGNTNLCFPPLKDFKALTFLATGLSWVYDGRTIDHEEDALVRLLPTQIQTLHLYVYKRDVYQSLTQLAHVAPALFPRLRVVVLCGLLPTKLERYREKSWYPKGGQLVDAELPLHKAFAASGIRFARQEWQLLVAALRELY